MLANAKSNAEKKMADGGETEKLKQAFLKACGATGSLEAAKAAAKALGDEPLASVRAKNGGSALHLAAFAGQLNTAQWLVERGVPVTGVDGGGGTPLHAACFAGNLAVCGWLASSGADIEAADGRGARPLHVACLAGREQVVDLLLRRGALKMCKTRDGATPRRWPARRRRINARTSWRASSGRPAPRRRLRRS